MRFWRENTLKLFGHVAQKPCSTPTFNRGCWGVARRGEWGRGMRAAFRKSFQNPWQQGRKIFFAREIGRQTTRPVLIQPVQFELLRPADSSERAACCETDIGNGRSTKNRTKFGAAVVSLRRGPRQRLHCKKKLKIALPRTLSFASF